MKKVYTKNFYHSLWDNFKFWDTSKKDYIGRYGANAVSNMLECFRMAQNEPRENKLKQLSKEKRKHFILEPF